MVKRRDVVKELREAAKREGVSFVLKRSKGDHDIFDLGGLTFPVPRHKEIRESTARQIHRETQPILGERWWQ